MKTFNSYIYCICVSWTYEDFDIIYCSYSLDDCKEFLYKNKKSFRYSPSIHKVYINKFYKYGIQHGRLLKYEN